MFREQFCHLLGRGSGVVVIRDRVFFIIEERVALCLLFTLAGPGLISDDTLSILYLVFDRIMVRGAAPAAECVDRYSDCCAFRLGTFSVGKILGGQDRVVP